MRPGRIAPFGESLGGAVAAWLPTRWLVRLNYDTRAALARVHVLADFLDRNAMNE